MKENFRTAKHKYDGKSDMNNIELDNAFVKFIDKKFDDEGDSDSDSDDEDEGIIGKRFITPFEYTSNKPEGTKTNKLSGCISYDGNLCITPNIMIWNDLFDVVTVPLMEKVDELLATKE
eukprot:305929_1